MTGRCPICGKSFAFQTLADQPAFPFCSARCRTIDLGRWIDGAYVVPGPEKPSDPSSEEDPHELTDEDDD